jgi:hypothetical protein
MPKRRKNRTGQILNQERLQGESAVVSGIGICENGVGIQELEKAAML